MKNKFILIIGFIIIFQLLCNFSYSLIIVVPIDQPTIQIAIDYSAEGDTIIVNPGIYYENLLLSSKINIHIIGSANSSTIIDGNGISQHVIIFQNSSGIIKNFTIRNGGGNYKEAIFVSQSNVIIENNILTNNKEGILVGNSFAIIKNNIIHNNNSSLIHGAIQFSTNGTGEVINNLIFNNAGPGIVGWPKLIINNTIVNNAYYGIHLNSDNNDSVIIINNIITKSNWGLIVLGGNINPLPRISIYNNNIWDTDSAMYWVTYGNTGTSYSMSFTPSPGINEIHSDPLFIDQSTNNYNLSDLSPCVNTGWVDTIGFHIPVFDVYNNQRIFGGRIDMGAIENMFTQTIYDTIINQFSSTTVVDTLYANIDTCLINYALPIDSALVTNVSNINSNTISTTWFIWQNGISTSLIINYNYSFTGNTVLNLVISCNQSSKMLIHKTFIIDMINLNGSSVEKSLLDDKFKIFPNPCNKHVIIEFDNTFKIDKNSKIEILDNANNVIYNFKIMNLNENLYKIDISNFIGGLYFVKITTNKMILVKKLLIE